MKVPTRKANVKFIYIRGDNDDKIKTFYFMNQTINIEESASYTMPIDLDKFKNTKYFLPTEIVLFGENNEIIAKHIVNIYCCENIFYLFLQGKGTTFEIIFLNKKEFIIIDSKMYLLDNNNNKYRSRLTFINYSLAVMDFNDKDINIGVGNIRFTKDKTSYQLSVYNPDLVIFKDNKLYNIHCNVEEFYIQCNDDINNFYDELQNILNESGSLDEIKLNKLFELHHNEYSHFKNLDLFKSKEELKISFKEEEYVEFFYKILVYYLLEIKSKNKNFNSKQVMLSKIKGLNDLKERLKKDNELERYQKVFALIQYSYIVKKYDISSFSYIKNNDKNIEKNSILHHSIKFFKEFISLIDEDSPVFFKLLEINSGYGYSGIDKVFTFNLLNVEDIKKNLLELIPDIIFFFNKKNSTTKAFSFSMTGEISINESLLFNKYEKMDLTKEIQKDEQKNGYNLAMLIARFLLHEEGGHTTFRSKSESKIKTPIKCVSEGKIKTMTDINDSSKSDDYIKIFPLKKEKSYKGDSGHYLETALGKINGVYTITYFDRLKDIGKLLFYPEYFVQKEKIDILKKYIFYKYLLELSDVPIELDYANKTTLEYDIDVMEKKVNEIKSMKKEKKQKIPKISQKHGIEHDDIQDPHEFKRKKIKEFSDNDLNSNTEISNELNDENISDENSEKNEYKEEDLEEFFKNKFKKEDGYDSEEDGYDSEDSEICI